MTHAFDFKRGETSVFSWKKNSSFDLEKLDFSKTVTARSFKLGQLIEDNE